MDILALLARATATLLTVTALAYLAVMAGVTLRAALRHGGRREETADDLETLAASRFTIPVSLILVADRASDTLSRTIGQLLALNYPEVETIVVAEGLDEAAIADLKRTWTLDARECFYRQTLTASPIARIYRSAADPRLTVILKNPAGRADAINCGVNMAKFRYVGVIDAGVTFEPDALLKAMSAAQRDPATVVGVSSHVEPRPGRGWTGAFGRLAAMRALMETRLAWRRLTAAVGPDRRVVVWRRDAMLAAGGFSHQAADPDLDMMIRLQASGAGRGHRIVRNPDVFGQIDPLTLGDEMAEAARDDRAGLAALRALVGRDARALPDDRARIWLVLSRVVTPLAEVVALGSVVAGSAAGWFAWWTPLAVIVMLSFGTAMMSNAALLLRGVTPGGPDRREATALLALAPFEFVCLKPALAWARVRAIARA
jgi:hypothetical protein